MLKHILAHKLRNHPGAINMASTVLSFSGRYLNTEIHSALASFADSRDDLALSVLTRDIIYCKLMYRMTPQEYFLFDFQHKNAQERKKFVSHSERKEFAKFLNTMEDSWQVLIDKYQSYLTFKPFYKREIILLNQNNKKSLHNFCEFANRHVKFAIKPLRGQKGEGIYVVDFHETDKNPEEYFKNNLIEKNLVAEELIKQDSAMAKFHPESVNTLRMVTWHDKGTVRKAYAIVRLGIGNSFVDNASAGGIVAAVDVDSGIIITPGMRETRKAVFERHPDTDEQILGAQIPKWGELNQLIEKVVNVLPARKWIGWDFALSKNGWVVVEANSTPSFVGVQMCTGKGIRDIIDATIGGYCASLGGNP